MKNKVINDKKNSRVLYLIQKKMESSTTQIHFIWPESDPDLIFPEVDSRIRIKMKWIRNTAFYNPLPFSRRQ